mmetsp:Transcript_17881/g.62733  ORF Transcript_17881/g.62733 Transcript_17881/m.62733 type:complete len:215 (-) Transcript_17881:587-1231(-)
MLNPTDNMLKPTTVHSHRYHPLLLAKTALDKHCLVRSQMEAMRQLEASRFPAYRTLLRHLPMDDIVQNIGNMQSMAGRLQHKLLSSRLRLHHMRVSMRRRLGPEERTLLLSRASARPPRQYHRAWHGLHRNRRLWPLTGDLQRTWQEPSWRQGGRLRRTSFQGWQTWTTCRPPRTTKCLPQYSGSSFRSWPAELGSTTQPGTGSPRATRWRILA